MGERADQHAALASGAVFGLNNKLRGHDAS
jgi:hypothetical protein